MVTTMADLDMTKDFDYARYQFVTLLIAKLHSNIFQRRGNGPIVAVCYSRSPLLLGICKLFMITRILNISEFEKY